jgi:hypothetical protein
MVIGTSGDCPLQVPDLTQTEIWSVAFATVCQPWAPFRCVDLDRIDRGSQAAFLSKQETRRWPACFALPALPYFAPTR